ncbi:uncharacterized protein LY79DRAFT_583556 [Colletotrichum navitas]|uniref:Uncharacterized protein n=1 Tax=Colletotrichum navitas TaxID=681940 RepID=A0AAD8PNZ1_9PEZI|nr:uncharacterized protein LY79DRAFT_583556 [Colletotrichum navitas]KAK1573616.1 hypothetical protein LY79DRAFT_583556 [Colletotrichum navitas]
MICSTTTTLQPGGYKEPAVVYRSAAGASGITIGRVPDHIRMNWNGARSLIAAPGFEVRKERCSSHIIALAEKVRAPRPTGSKPSTCIHPPHPYTTDIWEDTGARRVLQRQQGHGQDV